MFYSTNLSAADFDKSVFTAHIKVLAEDKKTVMASVMIFLTKIEFSISVELISIELAVSPHD